MASTTVTPTATWHNTSLQQSNGDVTDVAVGAAVTGRDAMDNIAYLTGGNTLTQVRREATVADLAALKSLTTQRDQDYFVLDSNKRKYQFDSGSSATADDYSVVQPTSGTGRYILQSSAVPQSTSKTWSLSGSAFFGLFASSHQPTYTYSTGQIQSNSNDSPTVQGTFSGFNPGDVLSSANVLCVSGGTPGNCTVTIYVNTPGDSSNTITTLGTATLSQPVSTVTTINFGTPYTYVEGDTVYATVYLSGGTGTWTLKSARIFGTRSYITQ
jgi:hypothetical protein